MCIRDRPCTGACRARSSRRCRRTRTRSRARCPRWCWAKPTSRLRPVVHRRRSGSRFPSADSTRASWCWAPVGTGKTSACMYPYVDQLLRWRSAGPDRRIGGLVLEVKGDFCGQVRAMLQRTGRESDYVEIGLDSGICYNPLHNDLDPYAVAYAIAMLLNQAAIRVTRGELASASSLAPTAPSATTMARPCACPRSRSAIRGSPRIRFAAPRPGSRRDLRAGVSLDAPSAAGLARAVARHAVGHQRLVARRLRPGVSHARYDRPARGAQPSERGSHPACDDARLTQRLARAADVIDIPTLDHLIVGADGRYYSFREAGVLPPRGLGLARL